MRVLAVLLSFFVLSAAARAATRVTVAQLEQFLTSSQTTKLSDKQIADRLSQVALSEQLVAATLARIGSETALGPKTVEQLELLAAESMFEAPPAVDSPDSPAPSTAEQQAIIKAGRAYVGEAIHLLPDFLAVRVTQSFDNLPVVEGKRRANPKIAMHLVGEYRREIAIRSGQEVNHPVGDGGAGSVQTASLGFSTWGEFGAMLAVVLNDAFNGSVVWDRWQRAETGKLVAVFRYAIPRAASHDSVDFCCYSKPEDSPAIYPFHDKPGYHGEIYIDPATGEIDRIALEAELREDDPVTLSEVVVQYGPVTIGGKRYVCPIRSVALSELHNRVIEKIDGVGVEEHVNIVQFRDYHKFASTARILTTGPQ
jgi:hypothetical protein